MNVSKYAGSLRVGIRILLLLAPFFTIACGIWTIKVLLTNRERETNTTNAKLDSIVSKAEEFRSRADDLSRSVADVQKQLQDIQSLLKAEVALDRDRAELNEGSEKLTQEKESLAKERAELESSIIGVYKPRLEDVSLLVFNANVVALDRLSDPLHTQIDNITGKFSKWMHPEARLHLFWITGTHVQRLHTYTANSPRTDPVNPQSAAQASFRLNREIVDRVKRETPAPFQGGTPVRPHRYIVLTSWNTDLSGQEDPFDDGDKVDFLLVNLRPMESEDGRSLAGLISLATKHQGTVLVAGSGKPNPDPRIVLGTLSRTIQDALFE